MISRYQQFEKIGVKYDLLVIGGGITGAGITLDAQSRGFNTCLIEMQDFAAGTSSRSTKLVHGGLRYLKQLQLSIVAQTGKERAIVYQNAPHITKPEWMMLPLYRGGTYGKWMSSLGILTYDYLAGVKKSERRQILSREETLRREPLLRAEGLKGSGYYVEYRTDDARLTLEVVKKALQLGATIINYVKATAFIYKEGVIVGAEVVDLLRKKKYCIYAKNVVNATGPWVDEVRKIDGSESGRRLHWTKGVHIVIDRKKIPIRQSLYFDTLDGRMVFSIPRENKVYIGTTDTTYTGNLSQPLANREDCLYLLEALKKMFPSISINLLDIESSWAGIRPLIHEEGKSPSEISRKDEIFYSTTGLISIAGGKLTGYRKMAEKVVDVVCSKQGKPFAKCVTESLTLSGGDISELEYFVQQQVKRGMELGLLEGEALELANRYGSNTECVYECIEKGRKEAKRYQLSLAMYGALQYGLQYEMVVTPTDFFLRRTGNMFFNMDSVITWREPVIQLMKDSFNWNEEKIRFYSDQLEKERNQCIGFI